MIKYFIIVLSLFLLCSPALSANNNKVIHLASIIYAEAISENFYGKSLVATVIWIRSGEKIENIHKTVTIPKQFAIPKYGNGESWDECLELSRQLYNGSFKSESVILGNGKVIQPDHFFHGSAPWWAKGRIWKKVGGLKFLRLDSYRSGR